MMVMIVIEKIIQFLKHVQILNVYCEEKKKKSHSSKGYFRYILFLQGQRTQSIFREFVTFYYYSAFTNWNSSLKNLVLHQVFS